MKTKKERNFTVLGPDELLEKLKTTDNPKEFGSTLSILRKKHTSLTQQQLADSIGRSRVQVSNIEAGKTLTIPQITRESLIDIITASTKKNIKTPEISPPTKAGSQTSAHYFRVETFKPAVVDHVIDKPKKIMENGDFQWINPSQYYKAPFRQDPPIFTTDGDRYENLFFYIMQSNDIPSEIAGFRDTIIYNADVTSGNADDLFLIENTMEESHFIGRHIFSQSEKTTILRSYSYIYYDNSKHLENELPEKVMPHLIYKGKVMEVRKPIRKYLFEQDIKK